MNFIESYKKGQLGLNKGLYMGDGFSEVSKAINGIQKGMTYGLAGASKSGKSTAADYGWVIEPYLSSIKDNIAFEIIYLSYEIDRVSKEFDFATFFLNKDYGITHVPLDEDCFVNGENIIPLSPAYLRGRLRDDNDNLIKVRPKIEDALKKVYNKRIIPMFGEYSKEGFLIKKGIIIFLENRNNPTGIRNYLLEYAKQNGKFVYQKFTSKQGEGQRIIGYEPDDPSKVVLVVTDHLRKILLERINGASANLKQCIDKYLEYCTEIKNWCNFSFLHIIHLNRSMSDTDRLKQAGDLLFPSGDAIKESGNLSEECTSMFTMFDPNDQRYNLTKHFGEVIKDGNGNEKYPHMRTLHLVENRHGDSPVHFRLNMYGNIKKFEKLII